MRVQVGSGAPFPEPVEVDQLLRLGQQVGPGLQIGQLALRLAGDDLEDLAPPLDLDRHPGLEDLIEDTVDVLPEGRCLERHEPHPSLSSYDCQLQGRTTPQLCHGLWQNWRTTMETATNH